MPKFTKEARYNYVKNYVVNRAGEYISSSVLANILQVSGKTAQADMLAAIKELGGVAEVKRGAGVMYTPVKKPAVDTATVKAAIESRTLRPEPAVDTATVKAAIESRTLRPEPVARKELSSRGSIFKNQEGYSDTTSAKAILRLEASDPAKTSANPGEVWECECSNGFTEPLFILKTRPQFCLYLKLLDRIPAEASADYVKIPYMGTTYYADMTRITSRPLKYIKKRLFVVPEDLANSIIMGTVARVLPPEMQKQLVSADTIRKEEAEKAKATYSARFEEEKEAYKKYCQEKIDEVLRVYQHEYEDKLLRAKLDIYERLLFKKEG